MASSVWDQLRHSYSRIIDGTLKDVRSKGGVQDGQEGGCDLLAEIERRWRADLEAEVSKCEGPRPRRDTAPMQSFGAIANVPAAKALGPQQAILPALQQAPVPKMTFMNGVRFSVPLQLPAPITGDKVPTLLQGVGLEASNVESLVAPKARSVVPARAPAHKAKAQMTKVLPPAKRMRCKSPADFSVLADDLEEPAVRAPAPAAVADSNALADSNAFAIVPLPGSVASASSGDSELGSDLDDPESSDSEDEHRLVAENIQLFKQKDKWRVLMQQGVVRIGNTECLFATAHGSFDLEEMNEL